MPALDSVTISVQHTCLPNGGGAELRVTVRSYASSVTDPLQLLVSVAGPNGAEYSGFFAGTANTFTFSPLADGSYAIDAEDQNGNQATKTYAVACGSAPAPTTPSAPCDLAITELQLTPATEQRPFPQLTCQVTTSAKTISADLVDSQGRSAGAYAAGTAPGPLSFPGLLPGSYALQVVDSAGCRATEPITVPGPPEPDPDAPPAPAPPTRFFAVGGLLPRPAMLDTPVPRLFAPDGQPRRGLHVEVELSREGSPAPFAVLRQTVRRVDEQVDAAPLLASLLSPGQPAPAGLLPYIDADTTQAFDYRWREVDAEGASDWQQAGGQRLALLSALAPAEPEARFVASNPDQPAAPLSVFPSGQLVQHAGYPLALTVWLPQERGGQDWFSEFRFLDQAGAEVGIYSYTVPAYLPAGMLRCELRGSPLPPCAASVEFRLTDTDRGYGHTCAAGPGVPPPQPGSEAHDFNISDFTDADYL